MIKYLKSPVSILTAFSALLLIFSDCNIVPVSNLKTVEVTYIGRDTFQIKAGSAPNTYYVENKVIAKNLDDFLKKAGVLKEYISSVKIDSAIATLPQGNDLTFEALDTGILIISGLNAIGASVQEIRLEFPDTIKGKVGRIVPKLQETFNVKNLIKDGKLLTLRASLKTNKPTPRSDIYLKYSFTIGYEFIQ